MSVGRTVFYIWNDDVGLWDNYFNKRVCAAYPDAQSTLKSASFCIACLVTGQCKAQHRLHISIGVSNSIVNDILLIRFQR